MVAQAILVAGLKPGSMASRRGGIEVGMVLKRVQRKKVIGLSFEQIMTMIKTAKASGTELRLQFAVRPPVLGPYTCQDDCITLYYCTSTSRCG